VRQYTRAMTGSDRTISGAAAWLERESGRLVEEWREACRIGSVSSERGPELTRMASWLECRAAPIFDRFEAIPTPDGPPILIGELDGSGPYRLLIYSHYDVVAPGDGWTVAPFEARLRDGAVFARGCGDDKADVMARLHALEAWSELRHAPPFSITWLCEGMEEIGSPGLAEVITSHAERLRADSCLWESYYRSLDDHAPTLGFGSRGVLNIELSVRLLDGAQHAAAAGVYRSAAAELIAGVASLTGSDGRVLIPGFYDDVAAFTDEDADLVRATPSPSWDAGRPGARALRSEDAADLTRRWLYEPTLNVSSIHAGSADDHTAAGALPASARAMLDFRLVPDQDPAHVLAAIGRHLDEQGFSDIRIELRTAIPPARCPMNTPLAAASRQAARELFDGVEPVSHAIVPGSGPLHLIVRTLGVPTVMPPGTIRPDSGMHGPDENARVDHYLAEVAFTVRVLELLTGQQPAAAVPTAAIGERPT
jgi:acetylornithine deacetylase/succinyl-diaminopimelate desuccinylase-like protein